MLWVVLWLLLEAPTLSLSSPEDEINETQKTLTEPKVSKTCGNTKLIFDAILLCERDEWKEGRII